MEVKISSPVKNISDKPIIPVEKKAEKIKEEKLPGKINTKDYLIIEPTNQRKIDIFKFIDPTSSFTAPEIKPINVKDPIKKLGVDITANIDKKISITYSTNLAESAQKHSMKLNYNLHSTTKLSIEDNFDGINRDNSGYKVSISSGFKF